MWVLTITQPPSDAGRSHCLPATAERTFTIGRVNTDIVFPNDNKVSKRHCTITTHAASSAAHGVPAAPSVVFEDCSSYGSTVSGRKVHKATCALSSGDRLCFGDRQMRLVWSPICLCRSRVDADGRAFIDSIAHRLGVHVTDEWSSRVTHVTMSKIVYTPKLLLALAFRVPIVVPHWLKALEDALARFGPPPDILGSRFLPACDPSRQGEPQVFALRPERAQLFAGRTFVFYAPAQQAAQPDSHVAISAQLVRACGGAARVLSGPHALATAESSAGADVACASDTVDDGGPDADGVAGVLHVQPARGLLLAPAPTARLEKARQCGRFISEEAIRSCLISVSLTPLSTAHVDGAGATHSQLASLAASQAAQPSLHDAPPPADGAALSMGPPAPRFAAHRSASDAHELQLDQQPLVRAQPTANKRLLPPMAAPADSPTLKRSRVRQPAHEPPTVTPHAGGRAEAAAQSGALARSVATATRAAAGAAAAETRAAAVGASTPRLEGDEDVGGGGGEDADGTGDADADAPSRTRVVPRRATRALVLPPDRPTGGANFPPGDARPAPHASDGQNGRARPAAVDGAHGAALAACAPQWRVPAPPIAGWRSRRASGDIGNVSFSRDGDAMGDAAPDAEAALTAVVPLVNCALNERVSAPARKRFSKAPVRRVGQAFVSLKPDGPALPEEEEEQLRREAEEDARYSAKADKLFREDAKQIVPSRRPITPTRPCARKEQRGL